MTAVAAIDCGTNSIRLLVAEPDGSGLRELVRELRMVRLGQGVDATREFHPDALARTFAACEEYAVLLDEHHVDRGRVRFVATSAARDARNAEDFFTGVRDRLGVQPQIISGAEEAVLSFAGATSGVDVAGPTLVVDIGGGSTELVLGEGSRLIAATSLDIGSVRIRERFLHSDPPTAEEVVAALTVIEDQLNRSGIPFARAAGWIGVAGTMTTLAGLDLQLPAYDRSRVHGHGIDLMALLDLAGRLVDTPIAEIRELPSMHPGRADVISAGCLIAAAIARRVTVPLVVSETDILDGVAQQLLAQGGRR